MARDLALDARLLEICRARGCSLDDAQELIQEAHLRAFQFQRSRRVRDADALLRRILVNLTINQFHARRSSPLVAESIDELDSRDALVDPAPGPERTLAAEQELDRVVSLLSAVSRRSSQVFVAQRGGYGYEEIAAAYGIRHRTVEKHVARAAAALQELMPALFAPGELPP